MRFSRCISVLTLLTLTTALAAQTGKMERSDGSAGENKIANETELLEKSREAGLLTDWHLEGCFGNRNGNNFARKFGPEHAAEKQVAKKEPRRFERIRYELVFPGGTFVLPQEMASLKGVFYAISSTYLTGGGDWNIYLESGAQATVFVDDRPVLTRGPKTAGMLRAKIHVESGYHSVMVKFTAQSAPFRIAILPLNSGSRRKNNTPYLQATPVSEYMMAKASALSLGRTAAY